MTRYEFCRQLNDLLKRFKYKPGWDFHVAEQVDYNVYRFVIGVHCKDTYNRHPQFYVTHTFPIPEMLVEDSMERWLLDRIIDVEKHEAMEFFTVDGHRRFEPDHDLFADPYAVVDRFALPPNTPFRKPMTFEDAKRLGTFKED